MALLRRNKTEKDATTHVALRDVLLQGEEMLERTAQAHRDGWGLGSAERWGLDQTTGTITWTFSDKVATAPAQILGSYNPSARSWMWAWANESLQPLVCKAAEDVRAWAEAEGHASLLEPKMGADEQLAATMAAIGFRVTKSCGFYRAPAGTSDVFIVFGPVSITNSDGLSKQFVISVDEQR